MKNNIMKYLYEYLENNLFHKDNKVKYSYELYNPFKPYKKINPNQYLYLRIDNFEKRLKIIEDKIKN